MDTKPAKMNFHVKNYQTSKNEIHLSVNQVS